LINSGRAGRPAGKGDERLAVTSSRRPDRGGPDSGAQALRLVLELSLADGERISGTVGVVGGPPATPFHGWIDLMSAISDLAGGQPAEPAEPA
jgi:hypothetical protein